jgi:hypothetical protein
VSVPRVAGAAPKGKGLVRIAGVDVVPWARRGEAEGAFTDFQETENEWNLLLALVVIFQLC